MRKVAEKDFMNYDPQERSSRFGIKADFITWDPCELHCCPKGIQYVSFRAS